MAKEKLSLQEQEKKIREDMQAKLLKLKTKQDKQRREAGLAVFSEVEKLGLADKLDLVLAILRDGAARLDAEPAYRSKMEGEAAQAAKTKSKPGAARNQAAAD